MTHGKISKREFIQAYQWIYGATKKEAEYIWEISSFDYKVLIICGYVDTCKKSFYQD